MIIRKGRDMNIAKGKSKWRCLLGLTCALAVVNSYAADHADDVPLQQAQINNDLAGKQSDINDIYAFMNPGDAEELVLVMTIVPDARPEDRFSTELTYNFLLQNFNGSIAGDHHRIQCVFPTPDEVSCSLGNIVVTGAYGANLPEGADAGLPDSGMRVFTGLRDDPFYFNGPGLAASLSSGLPMFDPIPEGQMTHNTFENQNILALVIGIDRNLLTNSQANPQLRIWAATESN